MLKGKTLKLFVCLETVAMRLSERLLHGEDSSVVESVSQFRSGSVPSQPIIAQESDFDRPAVCRNRINAETKRAPPPKALFLFLCLWLIIVNC